MFGILKRTTRKQDQIVVLDLGSASTKAVQLQRKGGALNLTGFTVKDAPVSDKALTKEQLAEHLKAVLQPLGAKSKDVSLVLGAGDSLLRHAEMPVIPVVEMRQLLKFNSKNYLQQDLGDHLFDCYIQGLNQQPGQEERPRSGQKCKTLVGGARKQTVEEVQAAARDAGLSVREITSSLVAAANAFELSMPDVFARDVVALVDLGHKSTTITILAAGELALSRVVAFGGQRLTAGIAEALGVTAEEAEGIKIGMPQEVESVLQPLLMPLGSELRASMDFFEHQHDKTVSQVYLSGGSARSEFVAQTLQSELMAPCKTWNPAECLQLDLPPQQRAELELTAPQLAVAIGAATAIF